MMALADNTPHADATVYEGFPVLVLKGQPDLFTLSEFERKLKAVFNAGHRTVLFDFREAAPLNPDVLRILTRFGAKMQERGGHFYPILPPDRIEQMPGPALGPFPDLDAAVAAIHAEDKEYIGV